MRSEVTERLGGVHLSHLLSEPSPDADRVSVPAALFIKRREPAAGRGASLKPCLTESVEDARRHERAVRWRDDEVKCAQVLYCASHAAGAAYRPGAVPDDLGAIPRSRYELFVVCAGDHERGVLTAGAKQPVESRGSTELYEGLGLTQAFARASC